MYGVKKKSQVKQMDVRDYILEFQKEKHTKKKNRIRLRDINLPAFSCFIMKRICRSSCASSPK